MAAVSVRSGIRVLQGRFSSLVPFLPCHPATCRYHSSPIAQPACSGPATAQQRPSRRHLLVAAAAAATTAGKMEAAPLAPRAQAVLEYWFGEGWQQADPDDTRQQKSKIWFMGGPEVDAEIVQQFSGDCEALLRGEYDSWQQRPLEALAGIIVGDQLSRNAYRGTAKMYANDARVLAWAKALLASEGGRQLKPIQRVFAIMPLMHSEELADQNDCVAQFERLAEECTAAGWEKAAQFCAGNIKYAKSHQEVVERWGRFPHRNAILGRQNTPEEAEGIAAGTIPKW